MRRKRDKKQMQKVVGGIQKKGREIERVSKREKNQTRKKKKKRERVKL